jgi:hypothetical protein
MNTTIQDINNLQWHTYRGVITKLESIEIQVTRIANARDISALFSLTSCILLMFYLWRKKG